MAAVLNEFKEGKQLGNYNPDGVRRHVSEYLYSVHIEGDTCLITTFHAALIIAAPYGNFSISIQC